ncbi:serine-rich adhesin for platelets-like [Euwallacea fornicatus]|uniref:serine-rich adhesin for platelets-like n=1 Tax=Euwallacea fornicatus TaxID=995702 RepID=UPI00338E8AE8
MQTKMEKPPGKLDMIVKRVSVPVGLEELMEGLTKEVLLKKPKDLYLFASEYFSRLIILRERSSTRKAYPIRVVQSVTQAKTPLKSTRHLSRQISVRGKESTGQKEEPKKVTAPSKVSTPKEKKASSNESTPKENKRAPSSIRGQQLKPKGKTREKFSVPGRKVDEVVAITDKKAVRHLKKSDAEMRKVKTVDAIASEVDSLTGAAAVKVKKTILPKNGDNIIDENPKMSENFGPGDSKMAHSDRKYMSIIGKSVSSLDNDPDAVETVEDDAKIKSDRANFSQEDNLSRPSGHINSIEVQKRENLTIDPLQQERKEIEKGLTVREVEVEKTTLKSFENTEAVVEANTLAVGSILEQTHSPEINENNINHEQFNHGDMLKHTKTEHPNLSEERIGGTENVDEAIGSKSNKLPNIEATAKIEQTSEANDDELSKYKHIDTIVDEEPLKEISINDVIGEDNKQKINNQVEQVHPEVTTSKGMGTKLEKQNEIEDNVTPQDENIKASAIPKSDNKILSTKSTDLTGKEENGSSLEDIRDAANLREISNKVEDVVPAETLLSKASKSKTGISKNIEDSINQIKIVNESVDEDDGESNKRKDSNEPIFKKSKNNNSNNQDDKPNEEEVLKFPENIKTDQPITSSNTDGQSSSTETEDKLVSIEMHQLGSSDDMLIVSISDRPTPKVAAPETTENANSEPKLQFFRKSEELVQKENGKIRQTPNVEHLRKLIGTSAASGCIDTSTKEYLHSFLSNEQQYSSNDQEISRKIASGAIIRKIVETESLNSKGFEPKALHEEKVISGVVPDAILAISPSEATTMASEKSDGIQLSEKETLDSRGCDGLAGKASDGTPQTQTVEFESLSTHDRGVITTPSEIANENLEQRTALKTTETETTAKYASDILAGASGERATPSVEREDPNITGKENASDVEASKPAIAISDTIRVDVVESELATSTSEQHTPLQSTFTAQQVDSQAQKGALGSATTGLEISTLESQTATTVAETRNNHQPGAITQQTSEATSNASDQLVILPIIDSEVTHLLSNRANLSENKHVYISQPEEPQQKPSDASDVTEQDTSASLNNLPSSFIQSEQANSSQALKDASEVEVIASELSIVETTQKALNDKSDVSKQPEKHDRYTSASDTSTAKISEVPNSVDEHGKELISSSLEDQHLQNEQIQKTTLNTCNTADPEISETAFADFNQHTAPKIFAASENAHVGALIHSFLLSEQQHSSQSQSKPADLITVSNIDLETRKLLAENEASNKDASKTINDVTTFNQPPSTTDSNAARTKEPKAHEKELINPLDQSTNYPIEDLKQEPQSNEAPKAASEISDDIPGKSSELGTVASKQGDLPTFKSVKDLLDYDNFYITKDDYTESSSGTKSLQLIIVDEDRSEETGAAKMKRSTTIEDVEEMASFAEDSVVMQQRRLVGQETLRGFSMESTGDKIEASNSSSNGSSYGIVKSDISTQSVSESRVLIEDRTEDDESIKEISEQLIIGRNVSQEINAGDVVSSFVEADVVISGTANKGGHIKHEEMKIGSNTIADTGLVIDGKNMVDAIVGQHDDLTVRSLLNGKEVEKHGGFESTINETITKGNNDAVGKMLEDAVAGDLIKDKATNETSNGNTDSSDKVVAEFARNEDLAVTSQINSNQVENNEGVEPGTTETVTKINIDVVNKTHEDTIARHPVKDEAIKETPGNTIESFENLVTEATAEQNEDLAVPGFLICHQMENQSVEFRTTSTTLDAVDKINENIVGKDQLEERAIKDTPSKSIESVEKLAADTSEVRNSDLVATKPISCDQTENEEDLEFRITETVNKVHVDEVDKTFEDMVIVDPIRDEAVKEPFNKLEPAEKPVEDATAVHNNALTVTDALNGDQVKNNQAFEFEITKIVSEANVDAVDKTPEEIPARDVLKDETIVDIPNSNTDLTERLATDAVIVQTDYIVGTDPPNCEQVENKTSFESAITERIDKTNFAEGDETFEDIVAVNPIRDEAVKETVSNNTESAEKLIVDAVEHRTKEFDEEVILYNKAQEGVEEKDLKELQVFSKENTFVKDSESKRPPKIGEIEQVASVIEVVKPPLMITKREMSPKKTRKSRLMFKERSFSHSNVLTRERSKSSSSERSEPKMRRTQSVGILKSQEVETKSRIPTSDSRRSAGRRPLVRQLETNSKELAEKLNFKRSSDGESGEVDEKEMKNSGDAKLMVKGEETIKEVDKKKGGSSIGGRSIAINENHIAMEVYGAKEQNSSQDKSAIKLDKVVMEVNDVKAEGVKSLEKIEDFEGNNNKDNERNFADVRSSIEVKEIAKSVVENVEILATEALKKIKTNGLEPANEDGNISGDAAAEEDGKTANAAIKIQSAWKGFVTRKMLSTQRKEKAVVKIQAVVRRFLVQLHLDKTKSGDIDSSTDQYFRDTITDFSNGINRAGRPKDEQGTLIDESDAAQVKLDKNITVESIIVLNDEDPKKGLALETTTTDSKVELANDSLEIDKKREKNVSISVLQNDVEIVNEKDGQTIDPRINNLVIETDGTAKQNEKLSDPETLLSDKVEYFLTSTNSIDTNTFRHETKDDDTQTDVNVKKKDNDHKKVTELNIDNDIKIDDTNSEVKRDNDIREGHLDFGKQENTDFEVLKKKIDISDEKMKTDDIEEDIKTNEYGNIKLLKKIKFSLGEDPGNAKEEDDETIDTKIESLEIEDSAKHNKKPSGTETLADNKMESIPASTKSLEINDFRHETDDIEASVDMKNEDGTQNEAAGLNVDGDMKADNTDMEAKRNDKVTVGETSSGEEGYIRFEDVEIKVNISDENLRIQDEDKKKSNNIEGKAKIKEDGDISTIKSLSGIDAARSVGLKVDVKQKKNDANKGETDINGETVKNNVNEEAKRNDIVNEEYYREDENAEQVKENEVIDKVTENGKIIDEGNRKANDIKFIQKTLSEKHIQEANVEKVAYPKGGEALFTSIVQTNNIDTDEIVDEPQQIDAVDIPNIETVKVPDQHNGEEQQNNQATIANETLKPAFNEFSGKTIVDTERSEVLKMEAVEPDNDQKKVAESETVRRKIEEGANVDRTKTEITDEGIKISSHLKETPSKVGELIIEDMSKNDDDKQIVRDRDVPDSGIVDTTPRHIEDDSGSSKDGKSGVEVITKEVKADTHRNEAQENNDSNKVCGETKSQLISNSIVEDDSQIKEKNHDDVKYIDLSKENATHQLDDNRANESTVNKTLDHKPDFYRSDTVVEPLLVKKTVSDVTDDNTDSNNNTSKEETPLEEGVRTAISQIMKPTDVELLLQTLPEVPTHDLPPAEDDLSSFGSTDSVVTVIMKPKQEVAPRTLPGRAFSTSALEDRVELLDQVQNSLLDQLSGKSKFDIDQLRKELHDATLYKEESPPDAEVLEYLYDFDPEDDPEYERVARTPLRELPDIAEEDDVPETSGGLSNEIVISNDSIEIGKKHQRLLHSGELHDSMLVTNGQPLWTGSESGNRLKHTSEFHDTVVVPLPSGADVKITNASVAAATVAKQGRGEGGGTEHDRRDSGNQTSDQQPPAGAEAVTSRDVGSAAQAALKDAAPVGLESARPAQSPARTVNEAMESENNNNKRNNAIATNVPEKNMEAQAATKIQAGFRGYQVRKQLKAKNTALDQKRQLRKRTSRDNLKNPDLEEKSAVKIQAGVRGFLVRRRQKKQASNSSASA